jgi:hypothetical protein
MSEADEIVRRMRGDAPKKSPRDQALDIVREKLDPATAKIIELALVDAHRLLVIRDAFLDERDVEAVQMIRDLDPIGIRKVVGVNSQGLLHLGEVVQLVARPQLPFTADHFAVSPAVAPYFLIDDIRVGVHSQMIQYAPIAADLFATDIDQILVGETDEEGFYTIKIGKKAEARWGLPIGMPQCAPGQEIYVIVTCLDDGPSGLGHFFRGAFLGTTERH